MVELYDTIGIDYVRHRQPDTRIAAAILAALGDADTIVNVGAGTGAYEPVDRRVIAVEPSTTMIRQRRSGAPVVQAYGSSLPFPDDAFDASMGLLTIHHWSDQLIGIRELRRVARHRVVVFTYDPAFAGFWLMDYFPEFTELNRRTFPSIETVQRGLGGADISNVPIPHDCTDGFLGAYLRRPRAYLEPTVRSGMSGFARLGNVTPGLTRLEADLESGEWEHRYQQVLGQESLDLGYRLVVAE